MINHYFSANEFNPNTGLTRDYINSLLCMILLNSRMKRGKISLEEFLKGFEKPIPSYLKFLEEKRDKNEFINIKRMANPVYLEELNDLVDEFNSKTKEDKAKECYNLEKSVENIINGENVSIPTVRISKRIREICGNNLEMLDY